MTATAVKMPNVAPIEGNSVARPALVRRFEIADLSRHGGWIIKRLQQARPTLSDAQVMSWLKGVIYSSEFLFLYQPHGCALAQTVREETLENKPVVRERFVFAEEGHAAEAASFYDEFLQWAKRQQIATIIVEEMTDVPHDLIKERLGRLFERKQIFARL